MGSLEGTGNKRYDYWLLSEHALSNGRYFYQNFLIKLLRIIKKSSYILRSHHENKLMSPMGGQR